MHDSIFTQILNRKIPAHIIFEDEHTFVIPDKFPTMEGQLLVISKRQVPYLFDLEEAEYIALMQTTKRVAQALDHVYKTLRTCVVVEGFEVPHVHVRLYPCTDSMLNLENRTEADDETLRVHAEKVRTHLNVNGVTPSPDFERNTKRSPR
jgi:histidine triad (HIT) family protein